MFRFDVKQFVIYIVFHLYRIQGEDYAMERLREVKKKELGVEPVKERQFKKKKPKGPNPLSCKKKKKKKTCIQLTLAGSNEDSSQPQRAKRRRRVKIPEHVRQELSLKINSSEVQN